MNRSQRPSPPRSRHRAATISVATVAVVGAFLVPAVADERSDLEQRQQGIGGEIDTAKKAYDESSKAYLSAKTTLADAKVKLGIAEANLGNTRQALSGAQALDATLKVKLVQAEGELKQARTELDEGKEAHDESADLVRDFTVQNLTEGDKRLEAFGDLLHGEDPMKYAERMTLAAAVSDAQLARMQQLEADEVMLKLNERRVENARDQVVQARVETQQNVARQQTLTTQAEAQTVQVDKLVDTSEDAEAEAARIQAEDEKRLKELEAERARLEAEIARLAEQERALGGAGSGDGGNALSAPIAGPITSSYGMRVHPITGEYKLHDGTDFGASCGTPIHAAAGGVILEQYYNGGYGNRVILNNGLMRGSSIVTTYNHLSKFAVSAGDRVNRGDVIGYVGSTGYSTGCHLHFMVLVDGKTTDPMGWL